MPNWKKAKLSTLCNRIGDGIHGTPNYIEYGDIFFINGNNLKDGRILVDENTKKISEEEYEKNFISLDDKSLLISINGTLGNMAFYRGEKVMLGKSSAYLNFKTKINSFYYYYFQLPYIQKYFYDVATGSTIKNLSLKSIQEFEVPVPEEFESIIKILSTLDDKIELNNKINAELEGMAKLIYDYWFVQFDFPYDFRQGKPADETSNPKDVRPYKSSGGKMVWNKELKREVPEGWISGYLSDLGKIIGGSTPSKDNPEYFTENGIPWITPKDLSNNVGNKFIFKGELDVSEKGKDSASLNVMPRGTILMSSRAPIGYLAISVSDVTTNQGFKSFVPDKPFTTEFVYYKINEMMPVIENNASGSTFKEVSGSTLKGIKIVIPSNNLIEAFTHKVAPIFEKQENLQKQNQQLSALRDWLLPMLMNGQVRVD